MSTASDKLYEVAKEIWRTADTLVNSPDTSFVLTKALGYSLPPAPISDQGSWIAPDGTEFTWINHIMSSALHGPASGYWARVAKPGEGPGVPVDTGETPL